MALHKGRKRKPVSVLVLQAGLRPGPWTCRSLAAAGYRVLASHERGAPRLAARSRHADRVLYYPSPRDRPDDFLEWLDEASRKHSAALIIPLSESTLHLLVAELPEPGNARLIGPTIAQYSRICDKNSLVRAARSLGIETPPGTFVGEDGPANEWPPLPSIVKPRASATPTREGVVYAPAAFVETPEERDEAVARLVRGCGEALVQEVVGGQRFRVHFVRHRDGLSTAAFKTVRSYPRLTGMSSVSLSMATPPELAAATSTLLELVDYRGPGSTQFIRREGRFYLHDVNLRLAYSLGAEIAAGLDSPRLSVDDALGRPLSTIGRPPRAGRQYVWLGGEAQALVDGLRGRPTAVPVHRIAADLVLAALSPRRVLDPFSLSDPLPTLAGLGTAIGRLVGKSKTEVASR